MEQKPVIRPAFDSAAIGTGVPVGYRGRTDDPTRDIREAKYRIEDGRFDIMTGPAHIVYASRDSLRGTYTVASTFDQLAQSSESEGFGLFFGGRDLDAPAQRYTYFVVRGTGEYKIGVRDGAETRDVRGWTPSVAVPKLDADGRGEYRLAIKANADSLQFFANGIVVATLARQSVPSDGIAGFRVHQKLHLAADRLRRSHH